MPVHPQCQAILDGANAHPERSPFTAKGPEESRARYRASTPVYAPETQALKLVEDFGVPGPAGPVPVRLYQPEALLDGTVLPVLIFLHGGGWVFGDLDSHDHVCRALAHEAAMVVLSVDYRLAPENPFPAAVDDCMAVLRWVTANAEGIGGDPARIAVGGDSAGGNLSAVTALQARGDDEAAVAFQLLVYPSTDFEADTPSLHENADGYLLTQAAIEHFAGLYVPAGTDRRDPRISPIYGDLAGLPPAHVITAEFDPLRDEGAAYAEALKAAGVDVTYSLYPGMVHGFMRMGALVDDANAAIQESAKRMRDVLTGGSS